MDDRSEIGRKLAALRPTVEIVCQVCGRTRAVRAKKRRPGEDLQPLALYCSPDCRAKAHYQANRDARLEYQRQRRAGQGKPAQSDAEAAEPS